MNKERVYKKRYHCYVTWIVAMIFMFLILVMSFTKHWAMQVNVYAIVVIAVMTFVTFDKKINETVHAYVFLIISMSAIFLYSYWSENIDITVIVLCVLTILCSFYRKTRCLFLMTAMTVGLMIIHVGFLGTVSFASWEEIINFIIKMIALAFVEMFIAFNVYYMNVTEENLRANVEKARSAEHSKSDFLANMSHEIRTPMNAIVGMCELILREDISDEVRENCFNIQNAGRSLLAIINDILDFSKIDSGKAELIEENFNIGSTINDVINMAYTRKGDKNIEIIARIDPSIPRGLVGDEVRIKQIMINLMTNAVKFTNKGCVRLKVGYSRQEYGINLNVSVKDTGVGITEENLEKLFTSFQQVDTKKNRSVEGTGLGLAISKRLVAKMGGFINVSSTYGEGSEFKFVIPLKVSDEQPFIYVKEPEKVNIAIHLDAKKYTHPRIGSQYRKMIDELVGKFGVRLKFYNDFQELKEGIQTEKYSHCIIAREEYCYDTEYFNELAKNMDVLVIQDRLNALDLPKHVKCIYKPFYSLSIASVLNKEKYILNLNQKDAVAMRFTAPDAKILIVDDNITNLKVAEGLMKPYNMRIVTVMSGKDAIEALQTKDYDVVFMDHMMPEMDGVEATALIRAMEDEYFKKLPIIALTANAVNGVREMFIREGFSDFIAKPIELSMLDRMLKIWLPKELVCSVKYEQIQEEQRSTGVIVENDTFGRVIRAKKALDYMGGNHDSYFEVLNAYISRGEEYRAALDTYYVQQDWKNYVIAVHALKSSSFGIGAEELSELAKELELAGKAGEYQVIVDKHAEVSGLYGVVLEAVEKYLIDNGRLDKTPEVSEESSDNEQLPIPRDVFEACMEQIINACEDFDEEGIVAAVERLYAYSVNGVSMKKYFTEVKKFAADFEYDRALEAANKAAEEIMRILG